MIGVILSNVYRTIENYFYVPKKIIHTKYRETLKNYLPMFVTFMFSIFLKRILKINYEEVSSWRLWLQLSIKVTIIVCVFSVFISLLFRRDKIREIFSLINK